MARQRRLSSVARRRHDWWSKVREWERVWLEMQGDACAGISQTDHFVLPAQGVIESPCGDGVHIPSVPSEFQPVVGSIFGSLEDGIEMYRRYADIAGFDIRLSTQKTRKGGIVKLKYVVSHKHEKPKKRSVDSVEVDGHHRQSRQLSYDDKVMVHQSTRSNIGPVRAHKLQVCLKGGYHEVGSSVVDYKNFKRDLNNYVGDGDVQMVVNMLNNIRQYGTNFAFVYKIDNGQLVSMLWANELTRLNYTEFGDVMSFDATCRFNKYNMVFVPFTGINNYRRSVAFWVHDRQPTLVLTDQDASIKKEIPVVFPDARHRLCMCHIMKKLPAKVGSDIILNTNFRKQLLKLVWSVHLEPDEFEI
ncbi:protein FAR1-RELATED SEQUENCE 5-like [Cynara cardunculus var. scolymus]|uniref:protein FAR1-RELATED SEQUENCE 5-like n=1 Tax=Cynara cardunculus var. scolymus TaxID=59895 RepID=UPI000D625EBA|nr:protein FAR1-RELATED SEQUENCE 5-like [Cynara cardunculus var. scolymus]